MIPKLEENCRHDHILFNLKVNCYLPIYLSIYDHKNDVRTYFHHRANWMKIIHLIIIFISLKQAYMITGLFSTGFTSYQFTNYASISI